MLRKKIVYSGAPWEAIVGYSRAVRVGSQIAVSGCAPVDAEGNLVGQGNAYRQTQRCIEIIEAALQELGAELSDVIRTRMFVTDIDRWEDIARAHQEAFGDVSPATAMVEVSRLIGDGMLVEIEADAIVSSDEWVA